MINMSENSSFYVTNNSAYDDFLVCAPFAYVICMTWLLGMIQIKFK